MYLDHSVTARRADRVHRGLCTGLHPSSMSPEETEPDSSGKSVQQSKPTYSNGHLFLGSSGSGESSADFARNKTANRRLFGVDREECKMASSAVSFGLERAETPMSSREPLRTDSPHSRMSSRVSFCDNSAEPTGDVTSGRLLYDVRDRSTSPNDDVEPRVQTAAAVVKKTSSRLSFGIDRILGAFKYDNDEDDNNNNNNNISSDHNHGNTGNNKSCSDVDSDRGEDEDDAMGEDDEESRSSHHGDLSSPGPTHVEKKDFRDSHFFLPRFGLEHLHPAALLPHPGVIRVPTHRPQPVFPLWPPSYGLPWIDMRRDRFGCEYSS